MKLIILSSLLLVCLFSGSCAPVPDFDAHLKSIVKPYRFSVAGWELRAIPQEVYQGLFGRQEEVDDEIQVVTEYFTCIERIKALKSEIEAATAGSIESDLPRLEDELNRLQEKNIDSVGTVEKIIEKQIRTVLIQLGIFNPITGLKVSFPQVNFRLETLPCLLVISPRDRIEAIRELLLEPGLNLEEKEGIEAMADGLGVSSLVVGIGGVTTYPALVDNESSLRSTIETATEEWLHQYLVFKPLGFLYLLNSIGLSRNYEVVTMNETLASMVSNEISSMVYEKYYSEYEDGAGREPDSESDFNREMREIRKTVDEYLARGEIELAEEFMEEKRQYLASLGYYIRKLNQAYFAFHGSYADEPAFISPVGLELKELRSQSASLKDFLNTVASMTSRQELRDSVR